MKLWRASEGSGPPLLLLHGWGLHSGVWEPLLPALRERFTVIRIDLPGHGLSEPPPLTVGAAALADWARALLEVAPPRATWLGWSLGGLIAQQAALQAPQRVSALRLVASTPCFVQRPDWPHAMPRATFRQFAAALRQDPQATLKRFLALQVRGAEDPRATLRRLQQALAQRPPAAPTGLASGLEILLHADLRAALAALAVPAAALLGARDTLVPAALADALPALAPDVRVRLLEGAGHAPFLSHPEAFLEWLGDG
ncbi:MAG TPA: pimeloyl-[acyl-carrier protein] methyl ester esterase [Gammaproteobacteria bacterium]|nr:pimeloyl-[acyl-carrier protein] methyl ester esterase [Gammaproteobacteria bacterium]